MFPFFLKIFLIQSIISADVKLDELIPSGKVQTIERDILRLKEPVSVYLTGRHNAIEEKQIKASFIASLKYRFKENDSLEKRTMDEREFLDEIANKGGFPKVVVRIVEENSVEQVTVLPVKSCCQFKCS